MTSVILWMLGMGQIRWNYLGITSPCIFKRMKQNTAITFYDPHFFLFLGHELTDQEISSHRHLYVGFHLPGKSRHGNSRASSGQHKHGHGHGHGHGHHKNKNHLKTPTENIRPGKSVFLLIT